MMFDSIEKGKLLLSEPSLLQDFDFGRSVILLTEYNSESSIGFIINKPTEYMISDLVPDIEVPFLIYNGGPVEKNNVYFIHSRPDLIPYSSEISDGIFWGGDFGIVKQLINGEELNQNDIRFFLGYSGWSSGQLEEEVQNSSWIIVKNPYKSRILERPYQSLWKTQMERLGEKYKIWLNAPENPELN